MYMYIYVYMLDDKRSIANQFSSPFPVPLGPVESRLILSCQRKEAQSVSFHTFFLFVNANGKSKYIL